VRRKIDFCLAKLEDFLENENRLKLCRFKCIDLPIPGDAGKPTTMQQFVVLFSIVIENQLNRNLLAFDVQNTLCAIMKKPICSFYNQFYQQKTVNIIIIIIIILQPKQQNCTSN
jgi:hypothetical protein